MTECVERGLGLRSSNKSAKRLGCCPDLDDISGAYVGLVSMISPRGEGTKLRGRERVGTSSEEGWWDCADGGDDDCENERALGAPWRRWSWSLCSSGGRWVG
jgi:hypothetical protein